MCLGLAELSEIPVIAAIIAMCESSAFLGFSAALIFGTCRTGRDTYLYIPTYVSVEVVDPKGITCKLIDAAAHSKTSVKVYVQKKSASCESGPDPHRKDWQATVYGGNGLCKALRFPTDWSELEEIPCDPRGGDSRILSANVLLDNSVG
eukprot:1347206-Amorphochlora_amoeboformis.AAC.1